MKMQIKMKIEFNFKWKSMGKKTFKRRKKDDYRGGQKQILNTVFEINQKSNNDD